MLNKLYWIAISILVVGGGALVVHFGAKPRPVPIIPLSSYETPDLLVEELITKLETEIKNSSILLVGVDPRSAEHLDFWQKFLNSARDRGMKYDSLVADTGLNLGDRFPGAMALNTLEEMEAIVAGLHGAKQRNERVVFLLPTSYTSQMVHNNLAYKLIHKGKFLITSLSLSSFPRNRVAEKNMQLSCVVEGLEDAGTGMLGCEIMQVARSEYRTKMPPGKWSGIVQQLEPHDYIVLLTQEPQPVSQD